MTGRAHGRGRPAVAIPAGDLPEDGYRLLAIEPAKAPDGGGGKDWFSYQIVQGANLIRGYKRGSRVSVKAEVEQIVVNLNERRHVRRGRVDLTTTSKPTTTPAAAPEDASEDS